MYNGIEISEARLMANNIVFSLILLFTIIIGVVSYFVFYNEDSLKNAKRIEVLKVKAITDPIAEKRLRKMERKQKRHMKNDKLDKILTFSLILILVLTNLFVAVIPGWTDYIKKDYVVYGNNLAVEYDVHRYTRTSTITLEDGTVLTGTFGLGEGKHSERIVYSKRTKIVLGIGK